MAQMATASATGVPPMRALFLEFPDEAPAWEVDDQFMFGPDVLVAPVTEQGRGSGMSTCPRGRPGWTPGPASRSGHGWVTAPAPLEHIPVYLRRGGALKEPVRRQ